MHLSFGICQNAFESIKTYLLNAPIFGAPIFEKPLILYITAQEESLGAMLVQNDEENKERALYYLSRRLTENELNYSPVEKMCLALVFSSQKLRHYFQAHTIHLVAKADPVKYVMSKPILSGRLVRWSLLFNEFEIVYVPQKALKGQALANFLADYPIPADWEIFEEFPDEDMLFIEVLQPWTMFFDGAARLEGAGAGVIFVSSQKQVLPYAFIRREKCSNNVTEYQALILGLQIATEMKIIDLKIFGDSKLIINQLCGDYEVKKDDLVPYFQYASHLLKNLEGVTLEHVPREENRMADALANLATTLLLDYRLEEANAIIVVPIEDNDWRQPLINYLQRGKLPNDHRHRAEIRRRAPRFIFFKDTLFCRSFEGVFLRCLGKEESQQAMEESHSGIYGAQQSSPKLHFRVKRMGYYWPTMVKDCLNYAKRCQAYQFHANFIHQPPEPLHPTVALWPFNAWGLDEVGPLTKSSVGHLYILAATDYFSKWAEAILVKEVKKETIVDFIMSNIIFQYGVPCHIITDNGTPFVNKLMDKLCDKFDFVQRTSSMYNAPANGLAEAFNKTLSNLLKKVLIALQEGLTNEENAKLRLAELEALDEKRLEAQQQLEFYQARISKAFNKKVKPRWDGPYMVVEVYNSGAYKIADEQGFRIRPINGKFLKRYYP
ncbi:uncharacterized protein LOC131330914 [Rhododendron vialii]|uniref:uncharacterized protein LOC131330914 n=1 Tax=Rhododendron vialii TaxID=182163 RepID=UPI00265F1A43|nr:uncharacterized protein LOC131330914 [Rhododendron vialii]